MPGNWHVRFLGGVSYPVVGLPDDEDDFDFKERFTTLKAELEEQLKEEAQLNEMIAANLLKIKF